MRQSSSSEQIPVNVVGSSIFGRFSKISSEKTYNMYESDEWLINFAGYQKIKQFFPRGFGRGSYHSIRANAIIVVVNSAVYSLDQNLVATSIGNLLSNYGEVYIDENLDDQICLVDGTNAYIYNHGLGYPNLTVQDLNVSPLSPGDLVPSYVQYHDTFFMFGNSSSNSPGRWYAFKYSSPTTIEYASDQQLTTKPDYAIAIKRIPGQAANVLAFGTSVCQIYTRVGGLQNYRPNTTVNIDYGCLNVSTISSSDKYIAWLGINESNAPVIMIYSDEGATPISTDGIDYVLNQLKHPEQSTASFFRKDGHLFYQLTFYNSADNLSLVYDFNTKKFFHLTDENLDHHPALDIIYFNQKTYFTSLNDASLYELSTNYPFINYNVVDAVQDPNLIYDIPMIRITKSIRMQDSSQARANSFVFTMQQGIDDSVTQISIDEAIDSGTIPYRPRVDLSLSYDGGVTFGNTVARGLNPVGKRQNQITWESMGSFNDLTLKLRFWGRMNFIVNNGLLDVIK